MALLLAATAAVVPFAGAGAAPSSLGAPAPAGTLRAGVGVGDITPPVGTPQFAYTAREAAFGGVEPFASQEDFDTNLYAKTFVKTVGVHTRVRSRALVLESGGRKVAMVALDLGGFPYDLHQEVVKRIAATGITRDRLLMSATHSHGSVGPIWPPTSPGYAVLGGDAFDPRVYEIVASGITASILKADANLSAARAATGSVDVYDATNNRNKYPFSLNDGIGAAKAESRLLNLSPTVTVLRVDTAAGKPLGVWSNFAIHGTSFGDGMLHFTGDNMAVSERVVEAGIRSRAGALLSADDVLVNAQSNGPEGDISPRGDSARSGEVPGAVPTGAGEAIDYNSGSYSGAEIAGRRVGRAILDAWSAAGADLQSQVAVDSRFTQLALADPAFTPEPVGPDPVLGCGGIVCEDGQSLKDAGFDEADSIPGQGAKIPLARGPLSPVFAPMQVLRVGDLVVATAPFEVTHWMGKRITDAVAATVAGTLPSDHVVLAGLANGYLSYTSTPEEFEAYFYEGSFTLWGRQQGPLLQRSLVGLASALASGAPVTAMPEPPSTAFSTPNTPPIAPEGGTIGAVVTQPAATARFGQATLTWVGGDPAADDPHVVVERQSGAGWVTETTDDSYEDEVTHNKVAEDDTNLWTETWEPSVSTPTGTYRMRVSGASGTGEYAVTSALFSVLPAAAPSPAAVRLAGGTARVKALYPAPASETLRARPRLATGGGLTFLVNEGGVEREVEGTFEPATYDYVATGIADGATVTVVPGSVGDAYGNGRTFAAEPVVPDTRFPVVVGIAAMSLLAAAFVLRRRTP